MSDPPPPRATSYATGFWATPLVGLGLGLVAFAVLLPAIDADAAWRDEHARLARQLEALEHQSRVNTAFLGRVSVDAELAGRLVERQSRRLPDGVTSLVADGEAGGAGGPWRVVPRPSRSAGHNPFALVNQIAAADAPAVAEPYERTPAGGKLAEVVRHPRWRLYLVGGGLLACAVGLLAGANPANYVSSSPSARETTDDTTS